MATSSLRPKLECKSRREWRSWLRQNHQRTGEVWLVFYKKHAGRSGVLYEEAVEEAICFGWIDGLKRRIDEDRYAFRFSPRRPRSKWSPKNIDVAARLLAEGKMTKTGRLAFERRQSYDDAVLKPGTDASRLPEDVLAELKRHRRAWANLQQLAPGYRKQYIAWLGSAKRADTRRRRLEEAIRLLTENRPLGMK